MASVDSEGEKNQSTGSSHYSPINELGEVLLQNQRKGGIDNEKGEIFSGLPSFTRNIETTLLFVVCKCQL